MPLIPLLPQVVHRHILPVAIHLQFPAIIVIEAGDNGRRDRRIERVVLGNFRQRPEQPALVAGVDSPDDPSLVAQEFLQEPVFVDPQIGAFPVIRAQTGVMGQAFQDSAPFHRGSPAALEQDRGIDVLSEVLRFSEKGLQVGRAIGQRLVVPRGRGVGGEKVHVRVVHMQPRRAGGKIEVRGNEDDSVQSNLVFLEKFEGIPPVRMPP